MSSRITTLPIRIKPLTDDAVPNIRAFYNAAVSARFPAHQVNGIWHFHDEDVPEIMAYFDLRPKAGAFAASAPRTPAQAA